MDSIQYASAKKKSTLYGNILQASIEKENKNEFTHMKEAMYSSLKAHLLGRGRNLNGGSSNLDLENFTIFSS